MIRIYAKAARLTNRDESLEKKSYIMIPGNPPPPPPKLLPYVQLYHVLPDNVA